jgi:hypothetical protein
MVVDLNGPDGNSFSLIGLVYRLSKKLGLDEQTICDEMTVSDYENLLNVFNNYFGDYVILEQ